MRRRSVCPPAALLAVPRHDVSVAIRVTRYLNLGKVKSVDAPFRVTPPLLDVLELLLDAAPGDELHGWAIMKETKRTGPTVYQVLDRLARAGWVEARWEERHPDGNKPRRRFYRIRPDQFSTARSLLAARRPTSNRATTKPALGWDMP